MFEKIKSQLSSVKRKLVCTWNQLLFHLERWHYQRKYRVKLPKDLGPDDIFLGKYTAEEFDQLLQEIREIPGVTRVTGHQFMIQAQLEPVLIPFEDRLFNLGEYLVTFYWAAPQDRNRPGVAYGTHIQSLARPEGPHHPHISRQGRICYGNAQELYTHYRNKGDYLSLYGLLIAWLHSYEPGDSYYPIRSGFFPSSPRPGAQALEPTPPPRPRRVRGLSANPGDDATTVRRRRR